jgi:hypothetical protein
MNEKQVCQLTPDGYFVDVNFADESPLEPGVYLMPANCVDAPLPDLLANNKIKWVDNKWVYEPIPEPEPKPPIPEPEEPPYDELRKWAYREESDPLFFKWQRGETTQEEWLSKIAEIKNKYPKPTI